MGRDIEIYRNRSKKSLFYDKNLQFVKNGYVHGRIIEIMGGDLLKISI